jgi:septal ring factor EnvC (AmiA/AmiB activator)
VEARLGDLGVMPDRGIDQRLDALAAAAREDRAAIGARLERVAGDVTQVAANQTTVNKLASGLRAAAAHMQILIEEQSGVLTRLDNLIQEQSEVLTRFNRKLAGNDEQLRQMDTTMAVIRHTLEAELSSLQRSALEQQVRLSVCSARVAALESPPDLEARNHRRGTH